MMRTRIAGGLFAIGGYAALCCGATVFDFSMDTTALMGHPAGPFSLSFQLTDGSASNDANNTVMLSGFQFGGGAAAGSAALLGGATGDLASGVTLTDSAFLNTLEQQFTPGSLLAFTLSLTTNVDAGPAPDQFSFLILDSAGVPLPTQGLAPQGIDAFLTVDFDSSNPARSTFASDPFRFPAAGGAIDTGEPSLGEVPEPGTLGGAALGGALLLIRALRRKRRSAG